MRLIFAGTPDFAATALAALLEAGHAIPLVLTRIDKPAGRGQRLQPSPVKALALAQGLRVEQPASLKDATVQTMLAQVQADAMVVAAYGLLLPPAVLALPRHGCLNIHASLLPRWRGAAPIQRAIEAGDTETGITIMQMEAGLDTGPMLMTRALPIGAHDSAGDVEAALARLGGELIVQALDALAAGALTARPQPSEGVTYAHKILKREASLDWRMPAARIADRIRAFAPFPGCSSWLREPGCPPSLVKIWRAHALPAQAALSAEPGTIVSSEGASLRVACGEGLLEITLLQRPGARHLPVAQWLQAGRPAPGACFEAAPEEGIGVESPTASTRPDETQAPPPAKPLQ